MTLSIIRIRREQYTSAERLQSKIVNAEARYPGVILTLHPASSVSFKRLFIFLRLSFLICKAGKIVPVPFCCCEEQTINKCKDFKTVPGT